MTPNFIQSVDNIYWPLGGYSDVSAVIPQSEMADAVIFNGPTWYASPLYTDNGPYLLFDLTGIGYTAGQLFYVFDNKFRFKYSARAYSQDPATTTSVYYGYLDEDKAFLDTTTHGSRYFFLFQSPTGPQLSQFIIKHSADPEITQEYLRNIIRKNSIAQAQTALNEAFVNYSGTFNVHTLMNTLDAVTSFENLKQHPDAFSLSNLVKYSYFQPKHDTWACFTKEDGAPLYIQNIEGLLNWNNKTFLDDSNYQLLFIEARPKSYNTPINRMINGLGTPLAQNFSLDKLNLIITLGDDPPAP